MVDLSALINSGSSSIGGSQLQAGQRRSTAGGAGAEGAAGQVAGSSSSWSLPGVIGPLWGLHMKVRTCVDCTRCPDVARNPVALQ